MEVLPSWTSELARCVESWVAAESLHSTVLLLWFRTTHLSQSFIYLSVGRARGPYC